MGETPGEGEIPGGIGGGNGRDVMGGGEQCGGLGPLGRTRGWMLGSCIQGLSWKQKRLAPLLSESLDGWPGPEQGQ